MPSRLVTATASKAAERNSLGGSTPPHSANFKGDSMNLKFNSGMGAITCDKCNVIIDENFSSEEWRAIMELQKTESEWFCKNCSPVDYKEQNKKLFETIEKEMDKNEK